MKKIINKKGMFFGLDARIALAIFCTLSLISGVVLFKAVQKVEMVKITNRLDNIQKGIEYYISDTKTFPISVDTSLPPNPANLMPIARALTTNYYKDPEWSGPYVIEEDLEYDSVGIVPMLGWDLKRAMTDPEGVFLAAYNIGYIPADKISQLKMLDKNIDGATGTEIADILQGFLSTNNPNVTNGFKDGNFIYGKFTCDQAIIDDSIDLLSIDLSKYCTDGEELAMFVSYLMPLEEQMAFATMLKTKP